jgi:hypothetical protein
MSRPFARPPGPSQTSGVTATPMRRSGLWWCRNERSRAGLLATSPCRSKKPKERCGSSGLRLSPIGYSVIPRRRIDGCASQSTCSAAGRRSIFSRASLALDRSKRCFTASSTGCLRERQPCGCGAFPVSPTFLAKEGFWRPRDGTPVGAGSFISPTTRPPHCSRSWCISRSIPTICRTLFSCLRSTRRMMSRLKRSTAQPCPTTGCKRSP